MKAAIYTPYLDTLGGGERYILSAAKALSSKGYSVHIEGSKDLLEKASTRFGISLEDIKPVESIKRGDGYDVCIWLSDGSIPTLYARKNILHFQRPFFKVSGKSLINRAKFYRINKVIVNSQFTKSWIDKEYPVNSIVIYPPIDVAKFKPQKKEKHILYVGRFSQLEQSKNQHVLIEAFKKFYDNFDNTWQLTLAGASDVGRGEYVDELYNQAKGYPIKIIENVEFKKIKELYGISKIFWSAAGYGVDEEKHPQKMEHFGMTVVESMAAGCIPLIFDGGGHKEIIQEGENGYLWKIPEELIIKTSKLIKDPEKLRHISSFNKNEADKYSYANFEKKILNLI